MSPVVEGFRPSTRGLHFPNSFPEGTPALPGIPSRIRIPRHGTVAINDASKGLCGGMALTAIDYFEAGRPPPPETTPPGPDSPLFRHLVRRLLDSWDLPGGALRYMALMNPLLPDTDRWFLPGVQSRSRIVVCEEWPKIRKDLDGGHLSPLGLIRSKSWAPTHLSDQHQVVAYGYDLAGNELTLHLYDPNNPDDDTVSMSLKVEDLGAPIHVNYAPPDPAFPSVHCFFRVRYTRATPPP